MWRSGNKRYKDASVHALPKTMVYSRKPIKNIDHEVDFHRTITNGPTQVGGYIKDGSTSQYYAKPCYGLSVGSGNGTRDNNEVLMRKLYFDVKVYETRVHDESPTQVFTPYGVGRLLIYLDHQANDADIVDGSATQQSLFHEQQLLKISSPANLKKPESLLRGLPAPISSHVLHHVMIRLSLRSLALIRVHPPFSIH